MTIRKAYLPALILLMLHATCIGQEVVTGLQQNSLLHKGMQRSTKGLMADTLTLPFFDDFSYSRATPDPRWWTDDNAFINNTYSNKQITKGVATLDALDANGDLYETQTPSGFRADELTSAPLDLSSPSLADIYLSFLYERGGLSDAPEPSDSLTLQFYAPAEDRWYSVWRAPGSGTEGFRNVIIPVSAQRYLARGFRFRFANHASFSVNSGDPAMIGNCDIWNIDYVKLDRNRNAADTVYPDVAFRLPIRSLLNTYEAMPWKQFTQVYLREMGSGIRVYYRNNDDITRNVTRDFRIHDVYNNTEAHSFSGGAVNVEPQSDEDFNASLIYTFSSNGTDSALFRVTGILKTDEFDPKRNDTVIYYQVFKNYFAFDDGTSEGGYGINGLGSRNAMFAHRFTSYVPDTLRAVSICFNDSYQDANRRAFDLMVWSDNNGIPGNAIYSKEEVMVESGTMINGFYTYYLPKGVAVEGSFYVGWKQRSETFLNAGYDVNTPNKGRQLYWINGQWNESVVEGTVMIRPVLGLPLLTGIDDEKEFRKENIRIWPNPAGNYLKVGITEYPGYRSAYVCIYDLAGRQLMKVPYAEEIDISELGKGMYFVVTVINGKKAGTNRLIKSY